MDKVIDLLKSERERIKRSIKWLKNEIKDRKKAVKELESPEFIEKHKDGNSLSDDWTIEWYIDFNVRSNNRTIARYSEKLEEANDYLRQIERALNVLGGRKPND